MISYKKILVYSVLSLAFATSVAVPVEAQTTEKTLENISSTVQEKIEQAGDALEGAINSVAPTGTNNTASESSDVTTQEIKKRIEKALLEERVNGRDNRRGYFGEITRVTDDTLTIQTPDRTHIIPVVKDGVVIVKKNARIEVDDIAVGNWAIVLGQMEDDQVQAKRIIISEDSLRPRTPLVFIGTLNKIEGQKLTFTKRGDDQTKQFTVVKTTRFEDADGTNITIKNIDEDINYLVIGFEQDGKTELVAVRSLASLTNKEAE